MINRKLKPKVVVKRGRKQSRGRALSAAAMPAACRAASAAHMRRGVERQPRLSSHPCHARRRAPCAPVGALAVLHQPARRGAMHPGHCVGRQPACLSTEQERMLRTLAQHQLASNQALSPLHSRPRAPAAALLNAQAQEPPLVVAALCSAACEQRSARQTRGTPGRLWDGGPPSECEPHRRPCLPQPRASGAKRQRRACFSVTVYRQNSLFSPPLPCVVCFKFLQPKVIEGKKIDCALPGKGTVWCSQDRS